MGIAKASKAKTCKTETSKANNGLELNQAKGRQGNTASWADSSKTKSGNAKASKAKNGKPKAREAANGKAKASKARAGKAKASSAMPAKLKLTIGKLANKASKAKASIARASKATAGPGLSPTTG